MRERVLTEALRTGGSPEPLGSHRRAPRRAADEAAAARRPKAAEVDLAALPTHLGYLFRRAQVWTFQDFIRTFAASSHR